MKKITLIIIAIMITSFHVNSQTNKELTNGDDAAIQQQSEFLDSLVNTWYVKRSYSSISDDNAQIIPEFLTDETPDSVYISRLKSLPSPIMMSYNEKVKSWIDLYISRNRRTPYLIGMSEYYFPFFEEILDKNNLPLEFKYLPIIESALNPRARSRAGAVGLWQFMYSTGKMYGLEVNSYVDERSDMIKSSNAAAHFLSDLYKVYGDWTLVLAAYNCGPGNVNKAIRRSGGKTDYWEIYPYLPKETRGYVPAFIAATYTMNFYQEHNIVAQKIDMNIFTDTVMIDRRLHLQQVSSILNIPVDQLAELNPQYKSLIIPGNYQKYPLRLPVNDVTRFIASSEEIYKYKDSVFFATKEAFVKAPEFAKSDYSSYSYSSTYSPPSTAGKTKLAYTVKQGDTYGFISSWYNVRISDIKYWNNTYSNNLSIGQELEIWIPTSKINYYKRINAMSFSAKQELKGSPTSTGNTTTTSSNTTSNPSDNSYVWYKIKSGDNLWTIAQKYQGITDADIKKLNNFTSTDVKNLREGQYIKIKKKS
jgi:membrane-bound lytic murein transglycosylase D